MGLLRTRDQQEADSSETLTLLGTRLMEALNIMLQLPPRYVQPSILDDSYA